MNILTVATTSQWRTWLADHAATSNEVWLVIQHKTSPVPSPSYAEAIEQALCFGWIDSHARKHDATSFRLRFTPRRPGSNWSQVNLRRAEALIASGQMTPAGQAALSAPRPRRHNSALP